MAVIANSSQLNVAALTADDLYIQILQPPGYIQGAPTDIFACVGTASYGPLNVATPLYAPQDGLQKFGGISAASLTDPFDGATDVAISFGQTASAATIQGYFVRVSDGTDTVAISTLNGTASAAGSTATVAGTITSGDSLKLIATSSGITGSPVTVSYTAGMSDTLSTAAAGLAAAVNANPALVAAGIYAHATGAVVSLYAPAGLSPAVTWTQNVVGGNASATATLAGSSYTTSDTVELTFTNGSIGAFPASVTYTLGSAETATTVAAGLTTLINGDSTLTTAGVSATSALGVITITQQNEFANSTVLSRTITGSGSETVTFAPTNGHMSGGPTETIAIASTTAAAAGIQLNSYWTGSLANQFQAVIGAGAAANTSSVYLTGPNGLSEVYPNLPNTGFWAALATALVNGVSGFRGPSQMAKPSNVNIAVGAPTAGTYTFSGGTDGRTGVTTANLIGTDDSNSAPGTGMYALRSLNPAVSVAWLCGCTSSNVWATVLAFGQSEGVSMLAPFPTGTNTATAVAAVQTNGIHDPSFCYLKDWIYFYDPVNAVVRLVSPAAFFGGTIVSYQPQISPSNKPVSLVVGTERSNPYTGTDPYSDNEVGALASAGINVITNPVPGGSYFGIRMGRSTSLNPTTQPFEYWRMTIYLARSFKALGDVVGQLQSTQQQDPLRNQLKVRLNQFLGFLQSPAAGDGSGLGQIDSFTVVCNYSATGSPGLGVNTDASIAMHYLFALVRVKYLSSVWYFVLALQGGTTVVTVGATPGQNLVNLPAAA